MDRSILVGVVLLAAAAAATNCGSANNDDGTPYDISGLVNPNLKPDAGIEDAGADAAALPPTDCRPAITAQPLPLRTVTHDGAALPETRRVFVDDMFALFRSLCGGCHVDGNQGGWQVTRTGFNAQAARESLASMLRNDSIDRVMPPGSVGGKLAKDRTAEDPSNELMRMLKAYIAAGSLKFSYEEPAFTPSLDPVTGEATVDPRTLSPFRLPAEVAGAQTNLGSCIPDKGLYATETAKMKELDSKILNIVINPKGNLVERIGLPQRLQDTDLFTFDTVTLAKHGVIAWAPAYPAFVDNARAIRHVRVPTGASIGFDKATQLFKIPEGTRFYRTLLKEVTELDGAKRWRKAETQLIVVWNNDPNYTGFRSVTAVFGSYLWDEDETEATLVTDPHKDGSPFRDHMVTYIQDEAKAAALVAKAKEKNYPDPGFDLIAQSAHHYVVPGSRRCVECHQGSRSQNFVLGFQPLQINRRPVGQGGIIEPVGQDELTQLDRFINYGLIKGVTSADDIVKLEDSQGTRKPRNEYELLAQGYMLHACANCHNPRGSASEYNSALLADLDLEPSATGGIFQFPLDRFSKTIARGGADAKAIPYITPSLFDIPGYDDGGAKHLFWYSKCGSGFSVVPTTRAVAEGGMEVACSFDCKLAPWRSLIYRGVDAPFVYSDDLALYPSMPMHTPGYDCDAPRRLAEWMVSIPSRKKLDSDRYRFECQVGLTPDFPYFLPDRSEQPYVEVQPGQEGYAQAQMDAEQRLAIYRGVSSISYVSMEPRNYSSSPPKYESCYGHADIVDLNVLRDPAKTPVPADASGVNQDGIPENVHWVIYDPTQIPGTWYPRRGDWKEILVDKKVPPPPTNDASGAGALKYDHEKLVFGLLGTTKLTDTMRVFASKKLPMGLWETLNENQVPKTCDFTGVPKVSAYANAPPTWMKNSPVPLNGEAPVYLSSPGEYVYGQICAHCHGAKADSAGREATSLATMTGGNAAVTSFKAGIGLEENRINTFQPYASDVNNLTSDDWAARYYSWMALGGTKQTIPNSILSGVATADVLGSPRPSFTPPTDANMLSGPEDLCKWTLPATSDLALGTVFSAEGDTARPVVYPDDAKRYGWRAIATSPLSLVTALDGMFRLKGDPLVRNNGDEELWQRLCALDNPRPVRVLSLVTRTDGKLWHYHPLGSLYAAEDYPADAPVADHLGRVTNGINAQTNFGPWCIRSPASEADLAIIEETRNEILASWTRKYPGTPGTLIPYCPKLTKSGTPYIPSYASDAPGHPLLVGPHLNLEALLKWSIRGAINAGLATFVHVDAISQGIVKPTPGYNECELRGK